MDSLIRRALCAAVVAALVLLPAVAFTRRLESTRVLLARLRASGRAEAAVVLRRTDPETGTERATRGRLALELPGHARLEFPSTGEVLTLREDGGEWLQPGPRQLLHAGPQSAGAAMEWWAALLDSGASFHERPLPGRGYDLTPAGADTSDAQRVWLGPGGLPERLEIATASGERQRYDLSAWRFTRPRGRGAFVLAAPPGYETVELP